MVVPSNYDLILYSNYGINCTQFQKIENNYIRCQNINGNSLVSCCEKKIRELYGNYNLDQCYSYTKYNYSQIKFSCVSRHMTVEDIKNLLLVAGLLFLILGLCCYLILSPVPITDSKEREKKKFIINSS